MLLLWRVVLECSLVLGVKSLHMHTLAIVEAEAELICGSSVCGCGCGCCIVDAGVKRYVPYTLNDDSRLTDPWEEKYFECTLVMLPYLGNGHENAG